jgi:putative ABC transport system substrate-binding protein
MRRRGFILGFAAGAALRPVTGVTQTASPPVIACLVGGSKVMAERYFGGFLQGMRELGYSEGQNWTLESRFLDGDVARASLLAEELLRLKPQPHVLMVGTMAGVIAFKQLTTSIPMVSPVLVDPVGLGLAASHARPGGNVTGVLFTVEDLPSKQLALAVEMVPGARKIGLLVNPGNPGNAAQRSNVEAGAATLGIELVPLQARVPDDLHGAFENLAREKVAMVLTLVDAMLLNERKRIALLAAAARLPTMFGFRQHVEDGGLMSYGIELRESWRRSAGFVGKILNGAKPGDLPIEFPTKLELVINLTAAKVLGLKVPPTLLARADEVIE